MGCEHRQRCEKCCRSQQGAMEDIGEIATQCLSIFTTVPDRVCLTALKKFADLFAEFLLILICRFCNFLGGTGWARGEHPWSRPVPAGDLKTCRICRKIIRISANKSAIFLSCQAQAVKHCGEDSKLRFAPCTTLRHLAPPCTT